MTRITRMTRMTRSQRLYPFLNKKFKDFQTHISHSSRIPIIALSICLFQFFHNMTAILGFKLLALENLGWTKWALKFKDFQGACEP